VSGVELELAVIWLTLLLLGAGAIETLRQIRDGIQENYQASLARAMTTTDIAVTTEKQKVIKACVCGHAEADHHPLVKLDELGSKSGGNCKICECEVYRPKRGPWPGEVKV
jgi:hypothetical protein